MPTPDNDPIEDEPIEHDPRNDDMDDESAMPDEFIDSPENQPGDQSPPSP